MLFALPRPAWARIPTWKRSGAGASCGLQNRCPAPVAASGVGSIPMRFRHSRKDLWNHVNAATLIATVFSRHVGDHLVARPVLVVDAGIDHQPHGEQRGTRTLRPGPAPWGGYSEARSGGRHRGWIHALAQERRLA